MSRGLLGDMWKKYGAASETNVRQVRFTTAYLMPELFLYRNQRNIPFSFIISAFFVLISRCVISPFLFAAIIVVFDLFGFRIFLPATLRR